VRFLCGFVLGFVLIAPATAAAAEAKANALLTAELYGRTLGQASQCPEIAADRLEAAASLVAAHLKAVAPGEAARAAAAARLGQAMTQGAQTIRNGETTCVQAEAELGNIEHDLSP
jgi:hypothetical protein